MWSLVWDNFKSKTFQMAELILGKVDSNQVKSDAGISQAENSICVTILMS